MGASFMNFMFFWRPANCIWNISVVLLNIFLFFWQNKVMTMMYFLLITVNCAPNCQYQCNQSVAWKDCCPNDLWCVEWDAKRLLTQSVLVQMWPSDCQEPVLHQLIYYPAQMLQIAKTNLSRWNIEEILPLREWWKRTTIIAAALNSVNPLKPNSSNCYTLCHTGLTYHF